MIYLLAAALLLSAWRFVVRARREGLRKVLKGVAVSAVCGLLAGLFIGVGARVGMGVIPFANGNTPRPTLSGTVAVVLTFASYGIGLGVLYELLFRRLLRESGTAYGGLLMLASWYSLAEAGAQQLTVRPNVVPMVVVSGAVVALMWLPFGWALEALLGRRHRRGAARAVVAAAA